MRRFVKIFGWTLLVLIVLLAVSAFMLTRAKVQTRLANEAAAYFSKKLDTKVAIDKVRIDFLKYVHLEGVYMEDQQKDTLAFIQDFRVKTSSIFSDLWNDKTSIIKDVKLRGGVVNLARPKDSERWNYTFIEEAFATEDKDSTTSDPLQLDLKNVQLKNVRFSMLDAWGGQDIKAAVGDLKIKVNSVDIPNLVFSIKSADIQNTNFVFEEYKGGKIPSIKKAIDKSSWGTPFNPDSIQLVLSELDLKNVNFEYRKDRHISKEGLFDERHIVARDIQLVLETLKLEGESLTAEILNLSTTERCGLKIKKLKSKVTLNQQLAELDDLYLETEHSTVSDYYSMRYVNFHDFNDYINSVTMYARFKNSIVDKRDIAFFAGNVKQLPNVTRLSGKGEGTVADLFVPNIKIDAPNLRYAGSARIKGLPDIDNTYFELNADDLQTTGSEIIRIAPEANSDAIKWNALSQMNFKGKFEGGIRKFTADGLLTTNQGNADVDLFMNLNGKVASYDGKVRTNQLQLGNILGRKDLGSITMNGEVDGSGFDFENLNATVNASVDQFSYDGTTYKNITFNGKVNDKKFNGLAKSRDPNFDFDFEGFVDLSGENPTYNFKSDVVKVNLKSLGITPKDVLLRAKVNLDFTGKTLDEFVGKAIMQDAKITYENELISIPRLRLNSYHIDSLGKVLDLKSSVADARIEGQYSLVGIEKAVLSFLHYYIPTYIPEVKVPDNEIFKFDLLVRNANKIISIFEPKLQIDSGTVLSGIINTPQQRLNLTGMIPSITYQGIGLSQVGIKSNGNRALFNSELVAGSFSVGSSQLAKDVNLNLAMSNDTAHFNLKTNPVDEFLGQAELDAKATAFADRVQLDINPSTFILKDDKYRIFSSFPIQYTYDGILLAKDVLIQNGNQQLIFNVDHDGITNNATVLAENIDLEKISNYIDTKDLLLKGRVNSTVAINDIWGNLKADGTLKTVEDFRLNSDTIGVADIGFAYSLQENKFEIKDGSKLENGLTYIYPKGDIGFTDKMLNLQAEMKNTPISFANQYLTDIVDSLKGDASGIVSIKGPMDNPIILGDLLVKNAAAKLIFTGCTYSMDEIDLNLNKNSISFNPIKIYDEREEPGVAILSGSVRHSNYDTYKLDLSVQSDDLLGLNNNELEGDLFYGRVTSKVDMIIKGPIDNIVMDIRAKPLKGSRFYLPLKSSGDAGSYDFIKFRTLGKFQDKEEKKRKGASYFKVNMDIDATPDVLATIILDPNTQEKIEARGNGNISLKVDLGNTINMYNTYTVQEGIYKFNFRGLLPRDFDLEQGGTIRWSGDAYNADLDMRAIYKTKIPLHPLISEDPNAQDEDIAKREEETHVIVDLKGELSKPDISFDVTQPYNTATSSYAMQQLEALRTKGDQKELVFQSGMILLINSFRPPGGNINAQTVAQSSVESTVSDIIGSALSPVLNSFIDKLGLKNLSLNLDYNNYTASSDLDNTFAERRQVVVGLNYNVGNRFLLSFGNSLDFANANAQAAGANNLTYNGDFRLAYLLSPDGRYRLNAYTVRNFDYVDNRAEIRGGVGLSYKKSFNRWPELFKRARKTSLPNQYIKPIPVGELKKEEPSVTKALDVLSKTVF